VGEGLNYLLNKAAQGHEQAIRDLEAMTQPDSLFLWQAFVFLNKSRSPSMDGIAPIPVSEILAYCELFRITNPDDRERLLYAVKAMDGAFIEWNETHG